jgi:SH3-like domain-containing protein
MRRFTLLLLAVGLILSGPVAAWAQRFSVNVEVANIRSEPNTGATVIWQVEKYHPLNVIQKQGEWWFFEDFEGDRGWISRSLLDNTRSVIVNKDNCNVRSGPGTDKDIRFTVDKGVPFKVLGEKGQWLQIVHADGDQGWIHKALVW